MYRSEHANDLHRQYLAKCEEVESNLDENDLIAYQQAKEDLVNDLEKLDGNFLKAYEFSSRLPGLLECYVSERNKYYRFLNENPIPADLVHARTEYEIQKREITARVALSEEVKNYKLSNLRNRFLVDATRFYNPQLAEMKRQLYVAFYKPLYDYNSLKQQSKGLNRENQELISAIMAKIDALTQYTIKETLVFSSL